MAGHRIQMATLEFDIMRPKQSELQAVRPGFRNSFGCGRVGVKVVCGFPGGGWCYNRSAALGNPVDVIFIMYDILHKA